MWRIFRPSTIYPRPSTIYPRPSTSYPRPSTLDPRPKGKLRLYGVHYSALCKLNYFDCVRFHVIDPMHNLFLGTAKYVLWHDNTNLRVPGSYQTDILTSEDISALLIAYKALYPHYKKTPVLVVFTILSTSLHPFFLVLNSLALKLRLGL